MTIFVIVCAAMVAASLALIAWPLLKTRVDADKTTSHRSYATVAIIAIAIPLVAGLFYAKVGRWNWQQEIAATQAGNNPRAPEVLAMIAKLEQRLRDAPNDINGWILLGRSYMALEKPLPAMNAYQHAYDQSSGGNTEAALGLGEAMIVVDEHSIGGRAGELFEGVLAKEPDNPKALWYGAVAALTSGNLPRAHERLQHMLVLNPPQQIRTIIERQVQDIEQQMNAAGQTVPKANPQLAQTQSKQSARALNVQVSISPALAKGLDKTTTLFVLARNPNAPGPPLAAVRRAASDLPLSVTITDNDAMIQGHGIGSVQRVQVVARLSKTGTPQAQPGDLFGEAAVEFDSTQAANVKIVIDRTVPK